MDLIDRDELRTIVYATERCNGKTALIEAFSILINSATKVEAIPVRPGRWVRNEFGTRCSACGLYAYRDKFDRPWESPYCPNCGAKMDREQGATE